MYEINFIRIVAPTAPDDHDYLNREIANISNSHSNAVKQCEMPCTMILRGKAMRTYAQSRLSSGYPDQGRWALAPGWLIKDVDDEDFIRCADGDLYSDDLGFGKNRKIGEEATSIFNLRKNWTPGRIKQSKQELVDTLVEKNHLVSECHLLLRNNIIGIVLDPRAQASHINEAIRMKELYQQKFAVELPFYFYHSNEGNFSEVSEEFLHRKNVESAAFEELKKILRYGDEVECSADFSSVNFSNLNEGDSDKIKKAAPNLPTEISNKACRINARPSQILAEVKNNTRHNAQILIDEIFGPIFSPCETQINFSQKDSERICLSFNNSDNSAIQHRLSILGNGLFLMGTDPAKFNIKISDRTIEIDADYLIQKRAHLIKKFSSKYADFIQKQKEAGISVRSADQVAQHCKVLG